MAAGLKGKTLFVTGASRGIGKAIAVRAARDGANVAVAARTYRKHPKLAGTIHSTVEEIEAGGGRGLALRLDIRNEDAVAEAVEAAVQHFGGLDILVNNASTIALQGTCELPVRRFDLMLDVNVRGSYVVTRACIPHLRRSANPHVLNLSPPLNLDPDWFKEHVAYTISKYAMSMCALGMAEEFRSDGIAFNALWPRTVIDTAAIGILGGTVTSRNCRTPEIMADAAHAILCQDARRCTGNLYVDEDVLRAVGRRDFERYAVEPGAPLMRDLFLD